MDGELKLNRTISVIVCTYTADRWNLLSESLRAVAAQVPPPDELILVVDHNESLEARARAEFPDAIVVPNAGEQGLSAGRNTGLAAASSDIVVFLDDDAVPDPGWLAALTEPYDDASVVATGGRVLPVWETKRPRWMPVEFDWVVGCSYRGLPTERSVIRNPIGASMSMRRRLAVEAGGFRTEIGRVGNLPAGCEETELSIRLLRSISGSRILYTPDSTVRHHVTAQRARWAYFRSRCFQEGRSKAMLAKMQGEGHALSSERSYTLKVLPVGVLAGLAAPLRGDFGGPLRAGAIVAGLYITAFGYVTAGRRLRATAPSPSIDEGSGIAGDVQA